MHDTLGFDDNKSIGSDEDWQTGVESNIQLGGTESGQWLRQQCLIVIPKKTDCTDRPVIPATFMEKLSFYRAFTSSLSKLELFCMQQNNIIRFFWFYIFNLFCKSLPMTYIYIFLSSYSPDFHFFLPKMVPICYGLNWIFIITARFLLQITVYNMTLQLHYAISGLYYEIPWNRCSNRTIVAEYYMYTCMEMNEFKEQFKIANISYLYFFYVLPSKELFTISQIEYFDKVLRELELCRNKKQKCFFIVGVLTVWLIAIIFRNHLFKRYVWKILHYTQLLLCAMLFLILIHLVLTFEDSNIHNIKDHQEFDRRLLMNADYDLLAESMTAPPVAHVISSRTAVEIKPSLISAVMIISNGIYYIFKATTSYLMKRYCERWVNATISYWNYGSGSFFYFWPVYFATIQYGDLYVIIFFTLNAIVEFYTFLISFQCFIEAVKYEWTWMKPWITSILMFLTALIEMIYLDETFSEDSFIFWTSMTTLAETIIIIWIYPIRRLHDDITFHYGVPPTRLRMWSFMLLPAFYLLKVYMMLQRFNLLMVQNSLFSFIHNSRSSPTFFSIIFILGAFYAIYYYVFKLKKGWFQLFKPVPDWGPKDLHTRQLRKQFDFREYIGSQAPRELSRHLIQKGRLVSYKLDVQYDAYKRRSTMPAEEKEEKSKEH